MHSQMCLQWNVLLKNSDEPNIFLGLAILTYSYKKMPFKIITASYIFSSLLVLAGQDVELVSAWFTIPVCVAFGMAIAAVIDENVNPAYFYPHVGVSVFGALLPPKYGRTILFPILFCLMLVLAGYKRLTAYCVPVLVISTAISSQIGAAPLVALCCSACMLLPFAILCPLFRKEIPFSEV